MKKVLVLVLFAINFFLLSAQVVLVREGTTVNNTVTGTWEGVNIPRAVPTKLSFLKNSITSVNSSGYLLQAGDETPLSTNNNLNGAVITGNRLTWNGTDKASITHGMFVGYNINYTVKYNYLDKTPYGILFKSGTDAGVNMTYSSGYGAAYNIIKNAKLSIRMKGINGVQVYNNTFYSNQGSGSVIFIDANHDRVNPAPSTGAKIKNNIFYTVYQIHNIAIESACLTNFESDYNVFYCESGTPMFSVGGVSKSFAQWQAMGYDLHSVVVNPNFINTSDFVPASRLNYGTNLGTSWQTGLSTSAKWVAGTSPATTDQNGTWQAGAVIYPEVSVPAVTAPVPVYISSAIENATPAVLEMVYNLSLAAKVPAASAFSVSVNSVARNVNSVAVSGTKVSLTLASPVVYGDKVTVSYTKPATNPIQTAEGGQAASLTAQTVVNKVNQVVINPVFVSAAIGGDTPSRIDISYSLSLANIVPAVTAFSVQVNSVARVVNSVTVSGTVVLLTLASPVVFGDVVTMAYTRPSSNPLQTPAGGQAETLAAQSVTNKIAPPAPVYVSSVIENTTPAVLEMVYNLSLAAKVPAASSFSVSVNSVARSVNSVAVSGTKVSLTLASPVVYGDKVTVSYTKPATNPIQTAAGGQAASITAQTVVNKVNQVIINPVFVSAAIGSGTPSRIDISYNLSLANIVPAVTAFSVKVNSVARVVNSVTISGTVVMLNLASPVAFGDVVTMAYSKPATNPLQTAAGGQAATLAAQSVTNKVAPPTPVYVSSAIENTTPAVLEMVYNLSLAAKVPAASAFSVSVNSVARNVNSVTVSGTKVLLTLASPVVYGNVITVAYTKPATNPLQTSTGAQAATISAQPVTNRVAKVEPLPIVNTPVVVNTPPVVVINSQPNNLSGFIGELDATGSYDLNKDNLTYTWVVPSNIAVSSTTSPKIKFLSPVVNSPQTVEFKLNISDGKTVQSKAVKVEILPYKPELEVAEIVKIEYSGYQSPHYPHNILDGNIGTMWSANGDNQWIILELKEAFTIQHVKLAFQPGQRSESYFDIFGSEDSLKWEPILVKAASCAFSGDLQVFDFPPSKASVEFRYVKLVGHANSANTWNHISEFKIFGYRHRNPTSYEEQPVKLYPNPANEIVNIRIDDSTLEPDFVKIINLSGRIMFEDKMNPGTLDFQIPIDLEQGVYIVQLGTGNLTLFTQKLVVKN